MPHALIDRLGKQGIEHLWVAYTDYHGRLAGRDVPRSRIETLVEQGTNFAKANFNFTIRDEQVPNPRFGADTGDVMAIPDLDSVIHVPHQPHTALAFATLHEEDGRVWEGCPRGTLQRAVDALTETGLTALVAFEPEFYLFASDACQPVSTAGMYTINALDDEMAFVRKLNEALPAMGVDLEQIGKEYGQGQFEANMAPAGAVEAVDDLLALRLAIRGIAREMGLRATFMPKIDSVAAGCGLHVHLSLHDESGADLTGDSEHSSGLSQTARAFLAGWLIHAEGLTALGAPTANSYKRLQPASWAPAHVCWGIGNRATMARVPGRGDRARLEFRVGDNTANPYLFLAGLIWAGLDGVNRGLDPGEPIAADVGHLDQAALDDRGIRLLPRDAGEALDALAIDQALADGLGELIHSEFLRVKRAELASYYLQVTDWERNSYFDAP